MRASKLILLLIMTITLGFSSCILAGYYVSYPEEQVYVSSGCCQICHSCRPHHHHRVHHRRHHYRQACNHCAKLVPVIPYYQPQSTDYFYQTGYHPCNGAPPCGAWYAPPYDNLRYTYNCSPGDISYDRSTADDVYEDF